MPFVKRLMPFVKRLMPIVKRLTPFVKRLTPFVKRLTPIVKRLTPLLNYGQINTVGDIWCGSHVHIRKEHAKLPLGVYFGTI